MYIEIAVGALVVLQRQAGGVVLRRELDGVLAAAHLVDEGGAQRPARRGRPG